MGVGKHSLTLTAGGMSRSPSGGIIPIALIPGFDSVTPR